MSESVNIPQSIHQVLDEVRLLREEVIELRVESRKDHEAVRSDLKRVEDSLKDTKISVYKELEPRIQHVESELEKGKSNMKMLMGLCGGAIIVFEILVQNWGKIFGA